jgi:hypothetical protein
MIMIKKFPQITLNGEKISERTLKIGSERFLRDVWQCAYVKVQHATQILCLFLACGNVVKTNILATFGDYYVDFGRRISNWSQNIS